MEETENEPSNWHFYRDWGMNDEEFVDLCNRGADAGIVFAGPRRPNGKESMDRLRAAGHTIHIITDRSFGSHPNVSEKLTLAFLEQHGYEYDSLTFSADKTVVETDFFIEDKLQNYDALEETGCVPYLINRPWNHEKNDVRRRINWHREFENAVMRSVD
jgi:5'(3')-deoxyribonucleotidase